MEVLKAMADASVDIKALSLADTTEFGVLRMVVSDAELAKKVLSEDGVIVRIGGITAVAVPDEPGALMKTFEVLRDNSVTIEYMYAFGEKLDDSSVIAIRTDNDEKAEAALKDGGVRVLTQPEISAL